MTDEKPYVSPPPEADGNYKYYAIADVTPVRVVLNERGRPIGAETPDRHDGEKLKIATTLLGTIDKGDDASEITKAQFVAMCTALNEADTKKKHDDTPLRRPLKRQIRSPQRDR
jgi:hypothetical protein